MVSEIREWLVFLIDAGILWILVIEYRYDKSFNERMKSRREGRRKKYEQNINVGEMK